MGGQRAYNCTHRNGLGRWDRSCDECWCDCGSSKVTLTNFSSIRLFLLLCLLFNVLTSVGSVSPTNNNATSYINTRKTVKGSAPQTLTQPVITPKVSTKTSIVPSHKVVTASSTLLLPAIQQSTSKTPSTENPGTVKPLIQPSSSTMVLNSDSVSKDPSRPVRTSSLHSTNSVTAGIQTSSSTIEPSPAELVASTTTTTLAATTTSTTTTTTASTTSTAATISTKHLSNSSTSIDTSPSFSSTRSSISESVKTSFSSSTTGSNSSYPSNTTKISVSITPTHVVSSTIGPIGNLTSLIENSSVIATTNSPVVINSTVPIISTSIPSTNSTSIAVMNTTSSTPVLNSTTNPLIMNSTASFIMNLTSVPLSSMVCPTTTIYINCSSDIIEPSTSFFLNISTIIISPTANTSSSAVVLNFTSSITAPTVNSSAMFSTISPSTASMASFSMNYSTIHITPSSNITSFVQTSTEAIIIPTPTPNSTFMSTSPFSSVLNSTIHTSTLSPTSSSSAAVVTSAFIINPPVSKCDAFLADFTDAYVALSRCMLRWLHPMRICSNCSQEYLNFVGYHKKMFVDCGQTLVYSYNSKYQVIPMMFNTLQNNWNSLECDKCYVKNLIGDKSEYSDEFKAYIRLYVQLNDCFNNHTHDFGLPLNATVRNVSYDRSICVDCLQLYNKMQRTYEYYGDDGQDTRWCADINFSVNETRHRWSNEFKCVHKAKDLESVIALTVFFCFIPIVFYVGAKLHADVKERKSARHYHYESD